MGKRPSEGSDPKISPTTFGAFKQWISGKVEAGVEEARFIAENCRQNDVFSLATLKEVSVGIKESMQGALSGINTGWHLVTGRGISKAALPAAAATLIGGGVTGIALTPGSARADYLFTANNTAPVLIDLDTGTETGLSTSLYPTTYGGSLSGFYDSSAGKLVLSYVDYTADTGSEGLLVIDDITGSPSSTIHALGDDPGKVKYDPITGNTSLAQEDGAVLCPDYENVASCTTYDYIGYDVVAFDTDEGGTGRGVVLLPATGYEVIDLATGTVEFSDTMSYPSDVTIDRDTGLAYIADALGYEIRIVDIGAATPTEVGSESFTLAPSDLELFEDYAGAKTLAVSSWWSTSQIDLFEVSGSTLTLLGTETHSDPSTEADVLAVNEDGDTIYVIWGYAGETLELDVSSSAWNGISYPSSYGSPNSIVYIPDATAAGVDADGDGYYEDEDCDDGDPSVHEEIEGVADADGDGYANASGSVVSFCSVSLPSGYLDPAYATDCNDSDVTVHATITYAVDDDGDGYGDGSNLEDLCSATAPSGYTTIAYATDCDDTNALAWTYAYWYYDGDLDGFGDNIYQYLCGASGYYTATVNSDCDDSRSDIYPGAPEPECWSDPADEEDRDCDEIVPDECANDADGDGFEDEAFGGTDCDDTDPNIHPGADEWCDGVDEDCDESVDEDAIDGEWYCLDADGDGYATADCIWTCGPNGDYRVLSGGLADPDDGNENTYPGASEIADGEDNDGDSLVDECLWVEGADWTPEAGCTELDIETGAIVEAWAAAGGFYTLEMNDEGEPVITFHGVEGEIEVVRGEEPVRITGAEGGVAAWIMDSIGRMNFDDGMATFTIVDEQDDYVHYGVIESAYEDIEREDDVRVLEGEVVVANMETGEIDEEETTAEEVLDALEEGDTDDDDDSGVDSGDDDTGTPGPGGCGEGGGSCSANPNAPIPGLPLLLPIGAGLYLGRRRIRRRQERKVISLSEMSPDEAAAAFGKIFGDQLADKEEQSA